MTEITKLLKNQLNNIINILIALTPYLVSYYVQEALQGDYLKGVGGLHAMHERCNFHCSIAYYIAEATQSIGTYAAYLVFILLKIKEAFNVDHNFKAIIGFFFHTVGQLLIFFLILFFVYAELEDIAF